MADQTAMHRATELQAAMEEMIDAQERYDEAEGILRRLVAEIEAAKPRRRT
jgi:hypothetical protein